MKFINSNKKIKLSMLSLSIILSLCSISVSHATNVIADERALLEQQADIKIFQEGDCSTVGDCSEKIVINITSPDENGLSHNKYTQFNVSNSMDEVVLNNNLSKNIDGNPNLNDRAAKIILNEVRSLHPSVFVGKVALSGQDAHVIIANPSGIDCHGCAFTNISHLTLTTGTPSFSDNKLQDFNVASGSIEIQPVDKLNPDTGLSHQGRGKGPAYLDLFTNTLNVRGKVTADDVLVIAGENNITLAAPGQNIKITPRVAHLSAPNNVDVKEMGGMYANKIRIRSQGNINNSNSIESTGLLEMVAGGDINNINTVGRGILGGEVVLYSGGVIDNANGSIIANDSKYTSKLKITAKKMLNENGKVHIYGKNLTLKIDDYHDNNNGDISIVRKVNGDVERIK